MTTLERTLSLVNRARTHWGWVPLPRLPRGARGSEWGCPLALALEPIGAEGVVEDHIGMYAAGRARELGRIWRQPLKRYPNENPAVVMPPALAEWAQQTTLLRWEYRSPGRDRTIWKRRTPGPSVSAATARVALATVNQLRTACDAPPLEELPREDSEGIFDDLEMGMIGDLGDRLGADVWIAAFDGLVEFDGQGAERAAAFVAKLWQTRQTKHQLLDVILPGTLLRFVEHFDAGDYPQLIDPRAKKSES